MANARSLAATTTPWTTKQTTSSPGTKAEPQASRTWANPAANTTGSNTPAGGHQPRPPKTDHQAGPHPPDATTKANNKTGNRPTGRMKPNRLNFELIEDLKPGNDHGLQKGIAPPEVPRWLEVTHVRCLSPHFWTARRPRRSLREQYARTARGSLPEQCLGAIALDVVRY